jgi:hypothetical protein
LPNKYVEEFFSLTCHRDILDALMPIDRLKKEISESMGIVRYIRRFALKNRQMKVPVVDFCAGNALTSAIACFLFPNCECIAIDKRVRERYWNRIRNFKYLNEDIYGIDESIIPDGAVVLGVHSCRDLANRIIELFNKSNASGLLLMPCCTGKMNGYSLPDVVVQKIGKYLTWSTFLFDKVDCEKKSLVIDNYIISPKNAIIYARK